MYAADSESDQQQQPFVVPWPFYDVDPTPAYWEEIESVSAPGPGPVRHAHAAGARKERAFDPIMVNGRSRPLSGLRQDSDDKEMESLAHSPKKQQSRGRATTGKTGKDALRKWGLMVEGVRYETAREYADKYPEEFKKAYPKYCTISTKCSSILEFSTSGMPEKFAFDLR
ncbi:hypothetical protein C8F01DRAFT_1158589 [Mycena amicta]|nr:hypothetical protein C8F01DRAFT_1158589 [Mycena amicta]